MGIRPFAALVAVVASGCITSAHMRLPVAPSDPSVLAKIVVEDVRPLEDRESARSTRPKCRRIYGDGFLEPTKVEFLRELIAERLSGRFAGSDKVALRLERFDTVERCDGALNRYRVGGWRQAGAGKGAIGKALGDAIARSVEDPDVIDEFALQLVGSLDGVPFVYRGVFEYQDLKIPIGARPTGNPVFRERVARLVDQFASLLAKGDPSWNSPEVDIVDVRAPFRSP